MQRAILPLAMYSGFVSLSFELVWARLFGMQTSSRAFAFPLSLGLFLLGLALGARWAQRYCTKHPEPGPRHFRSIALLIIGAGLFGWISVPLFGWAVKLFGGAALHLNLYMICFGASLFGSLFPLLAHYGIKSNESVGAHISYLYISNIIGSVAGSLLTGFVFFHHFPLSMITVGLGMVSLTVGGLVYMSAEGSDRLKASAGMVVGAVVLVATHGLLFSSVYQHINKLEHPAKHVFESRGGVIVVDKDDVVTSGGTYDGKFSTDLIDDTNGIIRPYALSAFHPAPKKILCIGLASGSWAQVLVNHPQLEELVIVEIEPNFIELLRLYPDRAVLLDDPRVRLVVDDGRRWMTRSDEKFDAIVSNTTWNWRFMASSLLSVEFMTLIKEHLKPGGIVLYNTTDSPKAVKTGMENFEHVYGLSNNIVGSMDPIDLSSERLRKTLLDYKEGGKPVFDPKNPAHMARLDEIIENFENPGHPCSFVYTREALEKHVGETEAITDSNMGSEWDATSLRVIIEEPKRTLLWHEHIEGRCPGGFPEK